MDFMDILDSSSAKIIEKNHSSNSLLFSFNQLWLAQGLLPHVPSVVMQGPLIYI